jgi:hypothetical protein
VFLIHTSHCASPARYGDHRAERYLTKGYLLRFQSCTQHVESIDEPEQDDLSLWEAPAKGGTVLAVTVPLAFLVATDA